MSRPGVRARRAAAGDCARPDPEVRDQQAAHGPHTDDQDGRAIYARRKAIVEPVFGQMSTLQNAKHLLLRGLDQARGEWLLLATCHNLRKLTASSVLTGSPPSRRPDQRTRPRHPARTRHRPRICTPRNIHRSVMWAPDTPSHQSSQAILTRAPRRLPGGARTKGQRVIARLDYTQPGDLGNRAPRLRPALADLGLACRVHDRGTPRRRFG